MYALEAEKPLKVMHWKLKRKLRSSALESYALKY